MVPDSFLPFAAVTMASGVETDGWRMIVLDSRPRRNEQILVKRGVKESILLDPRTGKYYTLEEVGGRVWELCDGSKMVSEIVTVIIEEFDAPVEMVTADVTELLQDLADEHLVSTFR